MNASKKWAMSLMSAALVFSLAACSGGNGNGNGGGANGNGGNGNEASGGNAQGKNEGANAASPSKVELSFWTLGNTGYDDLVKVWNAENPDIQVKVQNTGDQTAHHNNLTTALSAGSGAPDIFQLEIGFMERFINAQDKFHNLNDLGAKELQANYLEWKWKQGASADGSFVIGLPTDIGPTVVYYRTDLAEQAGLPTDPAEFSAAIDTWDKFAQVAKQFKEKTGKPFVDGTDLIYNALRDQSDGEIYFSKADKSLIAETNPQIKKAYDFTVKGIQEGWVGNWALWSPEWGQATNNGDFLILPGPAWMAGNIKSNGPDSAGKWRIAQLPEGSGNWGGSFLALPKESEHPKEAFAFISWLDSQERQLETFKTKGLMPSIPVLYEDPAFKDFADEFFGGQKTAAEYGKAAERVKPMFYGPLHDQTDSFIKAGLKNVLEKKADPAEEWKNAIAQAKKLAERS